MIFKMIFVTIFMIVLSVLNCTPGLPCWGRRPRRRRGARPPCAATWCVGRSGWSSRCSRPDFSPSRGCCTPSWGATRSLCSGCHRHQTLKWKMFPFASNIQQQNAKRYQPEGKLMIVAFSQVAKSFSLTSTLKPTILRNISALFLSITSSADSCYYGMGWIDTDTMDPLRLSCYCYLASFQGKEGV